MIAVPSDPLRVVPIDREDVQRDGVVAVEPRQRVDERGLAPSQETTRAAEVHQRRPGATGEGPDMHHRGDVPATDQPRVKAEDAPDVFLTEGVCAVPNIR